MTPDNTTPINASEYDKKIDATLPYYQDFYEQTIDIVEQCGYAKIQWLDLGCGTGMLELLAQKRLSNLEFVLVDPAETMIQQAREKLNGNVKEFLCKSSTEIEFSNCFNVVTAIQSHHYLQEQERVDATKCVFRSLKDKGVYITFENVVPEYEELTEFELLRWGRYQQRHGKTVEEAKAHNARCGVNYFPITVDEHMKLLREVGFRKAHVFWKSYMQVGVYAMK